MLKRGLSVLSLLMLATLLVSCASKTHPVSEAFKPVTLMKGKHTNKVDNFVVILDASQSMNDKFEGHKKMTLALETVERLNMTIPADMKLNGSLRTFGHGSCLSAKERTLKLYGFQPYSQAGFGEALENVTCSGGLSPLADALDAVREDLKMMVGKTAVIIVSDGKDMGAAPLAAAQNLAKDISDICMYTLQVGDDQAGAKLLKDISKVSDCGYATDYQCVYNSDDMAKFVKDIFFGPVFCPVPTAPKRSDCDEDGVFDEDDRCPNTPKGARVDQYGCWTISNVLFDFDKSTIKPEFCSGLNAVVTVFKKNPELKAEIQGHTDNIGPEEYNIKLSERRAKAVFDYLVEKGIDASQLATAGFGFSRPIASNTTKEGRAQNRRVEFRPIK